MNVFTYVLLVASPTTARDTGWQSDPLSSPALLCVLCFLVRNFAPSISFACIYTDMYLFVHGLTAIIYLTRVFSVFSAFLLVLHVPCFCTQLCYSQTVKKVIKRVCGKIRWSQTLV